MFAFPQMVHDTFRHNEYAHVVRQYLLQAMTPSPSRTGAVLPAMAEAWVEKSNNGWRARRGFAADALKKGVFDGSLGVVKALLQGGWDPALVAAAMTYAVAYDADSKYGRSQVAHATGETMNDWLAASPPLTALTAISVFAKDDPVSALRRLDLNAFTADERRMVLSAFSGLVLLHKPGVPDEKLNLVELFERGCPDWLPFTVERNDGVLVADILLHAGDVLPQMLRNGDSAHRARLGACAKAYVDRLCREMDPAMVLRLLDDNLAYVEEADPAFLAEFGIAEVIATLPSFQTYMPGFCHWGAVMKPCSMRAMAQAGGRIVMNNEVLVSAVRWLESSGRLADFENGVLLSAYLAVSGKTLDYILAEEWALGQILQHSPGFFADICRVSGRLVGSLGQMAVDTKSVGAALTSLSRALKEFEEQKRFNGDRAVLAAKPEDVALVRYAPAHEVAKSCTTALRLQAMLKFRDDALEILPHIDPKLRAAGMDAIVGGETP